MTPAKKRIRRKGRFITPKTDWRNRNRTTTKTRDIWKWLNDIAYHRNHPPKQFQGRVKVKTDGHQISQEDRRVPRY